AQHSTLSSMAQVEHFWGHLLMVTSPLVQSTLRLCLWSHMKPRIRSCLPRLVRVNMACFWG
ncbi:hypothetical protein C0989_006043, partial [Termitomyces sp. Mn162]